MSVADRKLVIAAESLGGANAALSFCHAILDWAPATPSGLIIAPADISYWIGRDPKIVSAGGALITPPTVDQLRRMARRDAAELGVRLSSLAKTLHTEWDCTIADGDLVRAACAAVQAEDILLLGQSPIFRTRTRVVLLAGELGPSEPARTLADTLALASKTSLVVLHPETFTGDDEIVAIVDRTNAEAIVLDLDAGPITDEKSLRRLYMVARCPIVALGGARIGKCTSETGW